MPFFQSRMFFVIWKQWDTAQKWDDCSAQSETYGHVNYILKHEYGNTSR